MSSYDYKVEYLPLNAPDGQAFAPDRLKLPIMADGDLPIAEAAQLPDLPIGTGIEALLVLYAKDGWRLQSLTPVQATLEKDGQIASYTQAFLLVFYRRKFFSSEEQPSAAHKFWHDETVKAQIRQAEKDLEKLEKFFPEEANRLKKVIAKAGASLQNSGL